LFTSHEMDGARLLHGTAWIVETKNTIAFENELTEESEEKSLWLAPMRLALLSQNAVGTIDQSMHSVLNAKYSVLRLLGLCNKVLILDEIHAYDTYMSQIIGRMLQWCKALKIPVIMLSATLPSEKKKQFISCCGGSTCDKTNDGYPLITTVFANGDVDEIRILEPPHIRRNFILKIAEYKDDFEKIAQLANDSISGGGCLCLLMNSVNSAQKAYSSLKEIVSDDTLLMLFHARFSAEVRQNLENNAVKLFGKNNIEERPQKAILVCTQVMEQSLDVDFDAMITELAPIDLLFQRMGRVFRFDLSSRPESHKQPIITVLVGKNGDADYENDPIYAPLYQVRTLHLLKGKEKIDIPADIRSFTEEVYRKEAGDEEKIELWARNQFDDLGNKAEAEACLWGKPYENQVFFTERTDSFSFVEEPQPFHRVARTRLDDDSQRMAFITQCEANIIRNSENICFDKKFAQSILLRSFSLRTNGMGEPPNGSYIDGKGLLRGVRLLITENACFTWNNYRIIYDSELGIIKERGDD
ncbi:MAG: CRISPR-associated helicase Cas3', partial [Clostridiales bacterium]|nr:CRISPR-associated helicase Cas3' [Clostridiales bacterium]